MIVSQKINMSTSILLESGKILSDAESITRFGLRKCFYHNVELKYKQYFFTIMKKFNPAIKAGSFYFKINFSKCIPDFILQNLLLTLLLPESESYQVPSALPLLRWSYLLLRFHHFHRLLSHVP